MMYIGKYLPGMLYKAVKLNATYLADTMCLELKDFPLPLGKIQLIKSFARPSYFHDQSKQPFKVIAA